MCGPCLIADPYPFDHFSPHVIASPDLSGRGNLMAANLPIKSVGEGLVPSQVPRSSLRVPMQSGRGNLMAANLPLKVRGTAGGYEANSCLLIAESCLLIAESCLLIAES
jgi:hypothetical protein